MLAQCAWLLSPAPSGWAQQVYPQQELPQQVSSQPARWASLPPTPSLPAVERGGYASVNGIKLWYAVFGHGPPVVFLHGGLANADYWGLQIPDVAQHYQVIVMDSRGHGRSTRDDRPYSYDLMADDVIGLLDRLGIRRAAVVGWSDGGVLGLDLAMRHPDRVSKVFAFGANTDPSGVVAGASKVPTFAAFLARARLEYQTLSPTPGNYAAFAAALRRMWATQPDWSPAQLRMIKTPVEVADGEHDEVIERRHAARIAATIPGASLVILPSTSHFAFLQDPVEFNRQVLRFLARPCLPRVTSLIVHHAVDGVVTQAAP